MRAAGPAIGAGARLASSTAAVLGRGDGESHPQRGEPERLRHRPHGDQIGELGEPRHDRVAAELDICLVHDDDGLGVSARELDQLGGRCHGTGRVVRVAAPDQARPLRRLAAVGAGEVRGDAIQRVGGLEDRGAAAGPEERARAEQDEIVGPGTDHDLLPADVLAEVAAAASRSSR